MSRAAHKAALSRRKGRHHSTNQAQSTKRRKEGQTEEHQRKNTPHPTRPQAPPYVGTSPPPRLRLYLPAGLDRLLIERVGRSSRFLDHYRWIISSVLYLKATDKRFTYGWVQLNKEVLRSIISKRKECQFIKDLCDWGILEQKRSWQAGRQSMQYRLRAPYTALKVKASFLTDTGITRRLYAFAQRRTFVVGQGGAGYSTVQYWLGQLRIDRVRALRFIRAQYAPHGPEFEARFIAIDLIAHRNFFFVIDKKARRAHHNLSNLAADLRQFLTINGQPLVQVDLSNSQPLFLHIAIQNSGKVDRTEVARMQDLVVSGKFYDRTKPDGYDRNRFKKVVFRDVLYGPRMRATSTTKRLKQQFPGYWRAISDMKRPDYTQLAVRMQAEEAKVIYKAVEEFAARVGGDVPILTVHDSLVTTSAYAEQAQSALLRVFQLRQGLIPTTTIKYEGRSI